ncbi:MAG: hypothetical protein ACOX3T_03875 [Bdellovibrionota bacterium]
MDIFEDKFFTFLFLILLALLIFVIGSMAFSCVDGSFISSGSISDNVSNDIEANESEQSLSATQKLTRVLSPNGELERKPEDELTERMLKSVMSDIDSTDIDISLIKRLELLEVGITRYETEIRGLLARNYVNQKECSYIESHDVKNLLHCSKVVRSKRLWILRENRSEEELLKDAELFEAIREIKLRCIHSKNFLNEIKARKNGAAKGEQFKDVYLLIDATLACAESIYFDLAEVQDESQRLPPIDLKDYRLSIRESTDSDDDGDDDGDGDSDSDSKTRIIVENIIVENIIVENIDAY